MARKRERHSGFGANKAPHAATSPTQTPARTVRLCASARPVVRS